MTCSSQTAASAAFDPSTTVPWEHNGNGLIYGQPDADFAECILIADVITNRDRIASGDLTDAERATAQFIVRACNAHAEMVAALLIANVVLETIAQGGQYDRADYQRHHCTIKAASAAGRGGAS